MARGLADFKPVAGRGVHYLLRNGAILIDDAYNANPDSMRAAIDVLADMPGPRVLVVGDMAETGSHAEDYHAEIGEYAKKRGIDRLLAAGEYMRFAVEAFGIGARHFETIEELTHAAQVAAQTPGTLLVKASNTAGLSFLGLGVQAPAPEWGALLSAGRNYHVSRHRRHSIIVFLLSAPIWQDSQLAWDAWWEMVQSSATCRIL